MMSPPNLSSTPWVALLLLFSPRVALADWPQLLGNASRSGNAPQVTLAEQLGLIGVVPLTDAIFAAPVVSRGQAFVVDGSGMVYAIDTKTLRVLWKFATGGGAGNCNNVAAPAIVDDYVHVGTMAGNYYVLHRKTGKLVQTIDCGEPIFSAPAVGNGRVYFATLGARLHCVQPDGKLIWQWDFVKEVIGFQGDRWKGRDWLEFRGDRVTWKDHFVCSRDICLTGKTVVMPAGGRTVFVDDDGATPTLRSVGVIPDYVGKEYPATFGQSA
ncbi:MAG: PQQ-like beta-propeller repeat protein, partial [Pirellulales bacterium]|nr:PQQ-like beta-propeller repeat protein [Pirellulales bacterium]